MAKLEGMKRQDVSIGDLMALAMILGVPPLMLIVDPKASKTVPIPVPGDTPDDQWEQQNTWNVLWWMIGRNKITPMEFERDMSPYYENAKAIISLGWEILDASASITRRERVPPDADDAELARIQEREKQRHLDAVVRIDRAIDHLDHAGVAIPPIHPAVVRRARELQFEVSDWVRE